MNDIRKMINLIKEHNQINENVKFKLLKKSRGSYENKFNNIEIQLSNPRIANGYGTNGWQLTITDDFNEDYGILSEWFDRKEQALIFLKNWIDSNGSLFK